MSLSRPANQDGIVDGMDRPSIAIEVADVEKIFWEWERGPFTARARTGFQALAPTTFQVRRGEFVSLVGPSGCGKTTVLRCVAGLSQPTRGTVTVGQQAVTGPGGISTGVVFQQVGLFPWLTAGENVSFALDRRRGRTNPKGTADLVASALARVGLGHVVDSYPHQLSGGMQQRVAIARALVIEPAVLLMDEPFGALDAQTRAVLQDELLNLQRDFEGSILFVTHDIEEAIYLSDRVIVMASGPGRIIDDIRIDLPRPRAATTVRSNPRFEELRFHIWNLLKPFSTGAASDNRAPAAIPEAQGSRGEGA